jgi:hypothetical protein
MLQHQLADVHQHIEELAELIGELPEIYERKFEQQLQPLLAQEGLLLQQNLLLRDQLQRALPGTAPRLLLAPAPGLAPAGPEQGGRTGPLKAPAQAEPSPPPAPQADTPPTEPGTPPTAPAPANPVPPSQDNAAAAPRPSAGRWAPPYRLALGATVAALGAFGLVQRQLAPRSPQRTAAAVGSTQSSPRVTPQAPAAAAPTQASAPASRAQPARPAGAIELLVITRGPSWIELRDSHWRAVYGAVLKGRKRFKLGAGLSLKAGRPNLVRVQLGSSPAQALPPGKWRTWHRFQPPGA